MQRQPFNVAWRFLQGGPKDQVWDQTEPKGDGWRTVDLPHDWSIELPRNAANPSGVAGGFFEMGRGFYTKVIEAPESWRGRQVFVEFEGIYMNAEVWLGEHFITRQPYGYTSFLVDLTPWLHIGQQNVLRVRVDNSSQLNSRWYSGSGIYRPAWLIVADPVHIAHWGVWVTTPQVSPSAALVRARTTVQNQTASAVEVTVRSTVIAPDKAIAAAGETRGAVAAGGQAEFGVDFPINQPHLWSVETPHMHRLETEVLVDGQVVDVESTSFGIRSLDFSAQRGFLLNGQPIKLKGGCVHHDNGVMGAASFPRSEERKVELHKASGYNAIRCAHNPPAPAFLDACDRLGMLVIDEAYDCWRDGKNYFDYHVAFDDWWQRDLDAMLLRDRNHPSVILWSIGNEVLERDRPEGAAIARMLADRVRAVDPTRPITSALCGIWNGKDWSVTDATFAELDVCGYNYQWKQYQADHARQPERIMVGTESFPIEALDNWQAVMNSQHVLGDFVWTSLDYLGESGIGRVTSDSKDQFLGAYPWHQANCGDLDLCGFKRPQSYYRDVIWGAGAQLYIVVQTPVPQGQTTGITQWGWPDVWPEWNSTGREGQMMSVDVYSACEQVELWLNGRSLGVQPSGPDQRHIAHFQAPYEPGELKAVGLTNGMRAAETTIRSAGEALAIRLTADRSRILSAKADLAFVTVEIVDENGHVQPRADRAIYFTVAGAGELAAVGSGNPVSEESYRGHARSTFHGRCLAVVKSIGMEGEIRLRAQADGLAPAEISITSAA